MGTRNLTIVYKNGEYKVALMAYDNCYFEKEMLENELYEYRKLGSPEEIREIIRNNMT